MQRQIKQFRVAPNKTRSTCGSVRGRGSNVWAFMTGRSDSPGTI